MYQLRTNGKIVVRKLFERDGEVFYIDLQAQERNQQSAEEFNRMFKRGEIKIQSLV